jgi:hypothetical protein
MKLKTLVYSFAILALTAFSQNARAELNPIDPGDAVGIVFDHGIDQDPREEYYVCNTWSTNGRLLGKATWHILSVDNSSGTATVDITIEMGGQGTVEIAGVQISYAMLNAAQKDSFELLNPGNELAAVVFDAGEGSGNGTVSGNYHGREIKNISYRCINEVKPDHAGGFYFCRYCFWVLKP